MLLFGHYTHVANSIAGADNEASLLEQSFVAYQSFKVFLPIACIVHDTDELSQGRERQLTSGV